MALDTSKVLLPKEVATVITKRAKDTSTIAALSPSEPQLFLDKDYMVFTGNSEAEVVAEGAQKSSYEETLTPVVGKRFKVQTTTRLSNELQWADDDAKLEITSKILADQAAAMGRVLDYVIYHAFDPKKKTTLEGFNALAKTAVGVTATDDRVADIDSLAEAVSDEYDINGIAMSKTMANELRKIRVPSTGQRFYPEIPINLQVGNLDGIPAATSGTVNGRLITPATGILAFLGDFRLIRWGMVRDIWSEIIEYGDPDNTGKDLKGVNQIAYRTEAMYSYAILDPRASPCSRSRPPPAGRPSDGRAPHPDARSAENRRGRRGRPRHPCASGKARRHPVRRRRRHHRMVGHHRQAVYVHAARADRRRARRRAPAGGRSAARRIRRLGGHHREGQRHADQAQGRRHPRLRRPRMDGYPSTPLNLSDGTTVTQAGGGEDETDDEKPFAQVGDLEARWHALTGDERTRAETLLQDASDLIRTTCPQWANAKPATLKRIACMAVKRAMQAGPDMSGVTQSTQTAGSYSESLSYANPAGDLYLTTSEKEALGGDGEAWAYDMAGGAA